MSDYVLYCSANGCNTIPRKGYRTCSRHRQPSEKPASKTELYREWAACYRPDSNGCIVPQDIAGTRSGYRLKHSPLSGRFDYNHRIAYQVFNGPIEPGHYVMHRCDNPGCFNPDHLIQGTPKENMADKMLKGRHRTTPRSNNLSKETVLAIKRDLASGLSGYGTAKKNNVSQMTVSNIRRGKTYRNVKFSGWKPSATRKPGRAPKERNRRKGN